MRETVLVIREFDKFSETLAQAGLKVFNFQAIRTLPLENLSELDEKLANIDSFDGLFLTSPKAAEIFLQSVRGKNFEFGGKVYVLGNRTGRLFEDTNFKIVARENANTAEELINSFETKEFAGKRFLFLRGDKSLRTIPELLKNIAAVDEVIVYKTIENSVEKALTGEISAKLQHGEIGWICFFSPSGIEGFINAFGGSSSLNTVKIAAIGETTAKSAATRKLNVDFVSPRANSEDFARGLIKRIKEIE